MTEGTFDAYLYQLVENKQRFISQIMTSKAIVRSAEDIDEKALSFAEIKALAAGNPLIIEKTNLDAEVSKLKLLKQNYLSQIYMLEDAIVKYYPVEIKQRQDTISNIEKDMEIVKNNTADKFSPMTLNGKIYNEKEQAGKTILEICKNKNETEQEEIGEYKGMKLYLEIVSKDFVLTLKNNSTYYVKLGNDTFGNITRIDNVLAEMEKTIEKNKYELDDLNKQFENAKKGVEIPFDKEEELAEKTKRLNKLNKELKLDEKDNEIIDDEQDVNGEENNPDEKEHNKKRDDDFR